jgi:hypothetical protein
MTRLLFAPVLMLGFAFPVSAQDQMQAEAASSNEVALQDKATHDDALAMDDRNCLRETGSRIATRIKPRRDAQTATDANDARGGRDSRGCINASGRSYSSEDLRRTGHWELSNALRTLDPAIN